jgi:hypothetical protein
MTSKIKIIVIILLLVISVPFISGLFILDDSPGQTIGSIDIEASDEVIALPYEAEGKVLFEREDPISSISKFETFNSDISGLNESIVISDGNTLKTNFRNYFVSFGFPKFSGKEFASIGFTDSSPGIDLNEYDFLDIEITVYDRDPEEMNMGCTFYIVGLGSDNSGVKSYASQSSVVLDGSMDSYIFETFNGNTVGGSSFTVHFFLDVNHESLSDSRVRIYINDILYDDTALTGTKFFDEEITLLSSIRINKFIISESDFHEKVGEYSVSFSNLKITGFKAS